MSILAQSGDSDPHMDEAPRRSRLLDNPPATCRTYAWCVEDGPHTDHFSDVVTVPFTRHPQDNHPDAYLTHEDGSTPTIVLRDAELTATQARQEAVKLRAFANQLDTMAGVLDTTEPAPQVTFATLPAGEVVRCHRVDGVLHVTVDTNQIRHTATEQVTG
jgi:hypothetical protein